MAVYLQDCNRNPIKDPNYILVTPNVMTSQAYRIILEEMEKRKKEQEAASWTLVSPAYPSSSSASLSTAASAWQFGRGGYGRINLYLLGGETRGNDWMVDRDRVGVGAGGDWDF